MPSRWEVTLAGPAGEPVPLAAPLAVVSGWLDGPADGPGLGRSGHDDQGRRWACGPLRAVAGGPDRAAVTVLGVRLLDDVLDDRLTGAAAAGRPVRLGAGRYTIAGPARLVERASYPSRDDYRPGCFPPWLLAKPKCCYPSRDDYRPSACSRSPGSGSRCYPSRDDYRPAAGVDSAGNAYEVAIPPGMIIDGELQSDMSQATSCCYPSRDDYRHIASQAAA